ncbi:MAG: hypothetical protein AAFU79_35485, partial [Myxococcota bacterium]
GRPAPQVNAVVLDGLAATLGLAGDVLDEDELKLNIGIAGNTGPRALFVLVEKGYAVEKAYVRETNTETGQHDYHSSFTASRDGRLFSARSEEALLGLVALWEYRGDDWRATSKANWEFWEQLENAAKVFDPEGNLLEDDD